MRHVTDAERQMGDTDTCPHCDADLRGQEIDPQYRDWYGGETHYSRVIGVEVRGLYDGVLYWQCPDCGKSWNRWPTDSRLGKLALAYIDKP